ncbi:MAG TPA: ABC transporter transmembrane domain-containing protein, partial [Anaerolineales bacterium]|nr:ABC transporter transmembrane domain-containing protein [Anaerolineales bacterium]
MITIIGFFLIRFFDGTVPLFIKSAVDSITEGEPSLMLPALGIFAVVTCRYLLFVFSRRLMRRISIALSYDLRKRLYRHVQKQGPSFFNKYSTGDIMSRSINDINLVRRLVAFAWVTIMTFVFSVSIALIFMYSLSPSLTLFVIPPLPVVALVAFKMSRTLFPYVREQQIAMGQVTSYVQENLNGIRT